MITSRIAEGQNHKLLVTVMEISVCFSWALDTYIFTLNFVCLLILTYNSQMNKGNCDLMVLVMI